MRNIFWRKNKTVEGKGPDFSQYSVQQLAIYYVNGFSEEGSTPQNEIEELRNKIESYVQNKPRRFRKEFKRFSASELERTIDVEGRLLPNDDDYSEETFI